MSELAVPSEPRRLGFKPEESVLKQVFEDDVARSIWLMVAAQHLIGEDLIDWSLRLSSFIERENPSTPERLYSLIQKINSFSGGGNAQYVTGDYVHVRLFVERLFEAVTGNNPVAYKIEAPAARKS